MLLLNKSKITSCGPVWTPKWESYSLYNSTKALLVQFYLKDKEHTMGLCYKCNLFPIETHSYDLCSLHQSNFKSNSPKCSKTSRCSWGACETLWWNITRNTPRGNLDSQGSTFYPDCFIHSGWTKPVPRYKDLTLTVAPHWSSPKWFLCSSPRAYGLFNESEVIARQRRRYVFQLTRGICIMDVCVFTYPN